MTTIAAQLPEPVLQKARMLAEKEHVPLEHIISLAITQTIGEWSGESYLAQRARHASRPAFDAALAQVPDVPAMPGDEWEPPATASPAP